MPPTLSSSTAACLVRATCSSNRSRPPCSSAASSALSAGTPASGGPRGLYWVQPPCPLGVRHEAPALRHPRRGDSHRHGRRSGDQAGPEGFGAGDGAGLLEKPDV